jgi:hypothetical protein
MSFHIKNLGLLPDGRVTGRHRVLNYMKGTRLSRRRMIWLLPPTPVSMLSLSNLPVCRPSSFLTGEGGGGEAGDKSYDDEKACSSKNHSILSAGGTGMNHQSCGHDGREGVLLAHHQLLVLVRDVTLQ